MKKRALILGVTGQDGSYLADILLERGYEVHGMYRRISSGNDHHWARIYHLRSKSDFILHQGDMLDTGSVERIIMDVTPQEIYNEADQDNVGWSYKTPGLSYQITSAAVGNILEMIRGVDKGIKFFQPVSAMMFGDAPAKQNEDTPFNPQSPYACAKVMAYYLARYYRQVHNMFVCTAIFYNHDSPRRTEDYLLHKIAHSAVRMANGEQYKLMLGNLKMKVDIGYAKEYMEAANDIMQLGEPSDYIIATTVGISIDHLVRCAFHAAGGDVYSHYYCDAPMHKVGVDSTFYRPGNQPTLVGDCSKAESVFGFNPKYNAVDVINMLISKIAEQKPAIPYEEHQI